MTAHKPTTADRIWVNVRPIVLERLSVRNLIQIMIRSPKLAKFIDMAGFYRRAGMSAGGHNGGGERFPANLARRESGWCKLLLADLDLAMTFLDVAQTSSNPGTVSRNRYNAHKAYDTALHLLKNLRPDAEQQQAIDAKLALLKTRLQAVGYLKPVVMLETAQNLACFLSEECDSISDKVFSRNLKRIAGEPLTRPPAPRPFAGLCESLYNLTQGLLCGARKSKISSEMK